MSTKVGSFEVDIGVKGDKKAQSRIQKFRQKVSKSFGKVQKNVNTNIKKVGKGFGNLNGLVKKGQGKLVEYGESLGGIGKVISKIPPGAAAAAAAIIGIAVAITKAAEASFEFAKGQSEELDVIDKASQKIGLSAEEYQKLEFASKRSGNEIAIVGDGLKDLAIFMDDVNKNAGDPKFIDALGDMGVGFKELEAASPIERLGMIGDALKKIEDPMERQTQAMRVLGGAGKEMMPLLLSGSEGIAALGAEAEEFGIISNETVAKGAALQDQFANFDQVMKAIKGEIFDGLGPAFGEIIEDIREFIRENKEFLTQDLAGAMIALAEALVFVVKYVVQIVDAWRWLNDTIQSGIDLVHKIKDAYYGFVFDILKAGLDIVKEWIKDTIEWGRQWEWFDTVVVGVQEAIEGLKGIFADIGVIIDDLKTKIVDFLTKFKTLEKIAIKVGLVEGEGTPGFLAKLTGQEEEGDKGGADKGGGGKGEPPGDKIPKGSRVEKTELTEAGKKRKKKLQRKGRQGKLTSLERVEARELGLSAEDLAPRSGGGGGGKKSKVPLSAGIIALRSGKGNAKKIIDNFNNLAKRAPNTKGVEPTVAITNNIFDIKFSINNPKLAMNPEKLEKTIETAMDKIKRKSNAKTMADMSGTRKA